MFIRKLVSENFRGSEADEYKFGYVNRIIGDNREGKTSIEEKIVYCLFGTTIFGSNRCDDYVKDDCIKTGAKMFVELEIEHPKGVFKIRRTKTMNATTIRVNGEKATQSELERVLKLDVDYFLSAFNPLYLISLTEDSATRDKAQKIIFGLFNPPLKEDILALLEPGEAQLLRENDNYDPASVRKENEKLAEKKLKLEGRLEELRKLSSETVQTYSPEQQAAIDKNIKALQEKKTQIAVKSQVPKPTEPVLADVGSLKKQVKSLRETYVMLKGQIRPLPPKPENGQKCQSCGQVLPAEKMNQLVAAWQQEVSQVKTQNNETQAKMKEITANGNNLNVDVEKLEKANATAAEAYNKALAEWKTTISADNSGVEARKIDEEIDAQIRKLKEVAAAGEKASSITKAKSDIVVVEAEIAKIDNDTAYNEEILQTIIRYIEAKVNLITKQFSEKLNRVSVKLYDFIKTTGELKPAFRITYDGNTTQRLCFSDKIRAGLEISALIRSSNNVKYPVFIDNSDLITTYDPNVDMEEIQMFFAIVMAGQKLTVESSPKADSVKQDTPAA